MSDPRRYDEAQTARIFRRALEMRPMVPSHVEALARGEGLTLEQLSAAAAEAGISVDAVRRAAAELDAPEALRASPFYGAPTRIVTERLIGRSVDPSEFDAFVDDVRREFGMLGVATQTPRSVTWSSLPAGAAAPAGRRISISLVAREAGTVLRLEEDLTPETAGIFGLGIAAGVLTAIVGVGGLGAIAPPLALLAPVAPLTVWAGARRLFRSVHARREEELSHRADRLAARAEEPIR